MPRIPPATASRLAVLLTCVLIATPLRALMESQEGNAPLSPANYTDWPGLAAVVNDASRVFHVWVNGNEEDFYRGDTAALTRALSAFAATEIDERVVILRPGRGELSESVLGSKHYDWRLGMIGGLARSLHDEQDAELIWSRHPTLTIYVGGGVDLDELRIPARITRVIGVDDLRERYLQGVRSSSARVRSYAVDLVAEVDPYGAKTAATIATLANDDGARSAVERALAELESRANDAAEVRSRHRADTRRIRRFIFAWRYPWVNPALWTGSAVAVALLAFTLVAVAKRKRRRREALRGAD